MSWLTPLFGGIVLAVVVPSLVALYFLRLRRSERYIPSTFLWKRSVEDVRANAPFQRLRMNLLLLLQILLLVLLGIALMQPRLDSGDLRDGRTVLLIDRSASMNVPDADESGRTRLDLAKEAAVERIEALHSGGLFGSGAEIMVIGFSDDPAIRTPFTDSQQAAIDAVNGIEPTDGRSLIGPALELARAYTTVVDPDAQSGPGESPAALELWSDGRVSDLPDQVLKTGETLEYHQVGDSGTANVGIASLAAERPYDEPGRIQVFVAVENPDPDSREVDLQLAVDGVVRSITPEPVMISAAREEPGIGLVPGRRQISFTPIEQSSGAVIEVSILGEDGLSSDNVAALVVPPAKRLRVALVGNDRPVLRWLLDGMALESLDVVSPSTFQQMALEQSIEDWDVVILADPDLDLESLPAGRYLSFGPAPPLDSLDPFGEPAKGVLVRRTRDGHPVMRMVNLDDVYVGSMEKLVLGPGVSMIAESGDGPMIMEIDRGPVRMIHVAFDPLDSNWIYQRSFVNFTANAIDYLGTSGDALTLRSGEPGGPLTVRMPRGATNASLRPPEGDSTSLTIDSAGDVSWGPARRTGLHEFSWTMPGESEQMTRLVAVNQFDRNERFVAAAESIEIGTERLQGQVVRASGTRWQDLWPWMLAAALALSVLEWVLWQRQVGAG